MWVTSKQCEIDEQTDFFLRNLHGPFDFIQQNTAREINPYLGEISAKNVFEFLDILRQIGLKVELLFRIQKKKMNNVDLKIPQSTQYVMARYTKDYVLRKFEFCDGKPWNIWRQPDIFEINRIRSGTY